MKSSRLRAGSRVVRLLMTVNSSIHPDAGDAHFVLCERARFIGGQHGDGAKRFDAMQVFYQNIELAHPLRCNREQ